jgi:peroxiredoxin
MGGAAQRATRSPWVSPWPTLLAALALAAIGSPSACARDYALLGRAAPDFALHAVNGPNVRLSEHVGQVVVISFWGSGCDSCREQLEALERDFSRERSRGLRVYGIEVTGDPRSGLRFANGMRVTFPLLLDPKNTVSRRYRIDNLPMTLLIDRDGKVRYLVRDFNETSRKLCEDELRQLLTE